VCEHHPTVEYRGNANPVFAFDKGIEGKDIEWSVKNHIEPDRIPPPRRTCHQQWIERVSIIVHHLYKQRGRPDWLFVMIWIRDDELLDINNIRDEEQIDHKEADKQPIVFALSERDNLVHEICSLHR